MFYEYGPCFQYHVVLLLQMGVVWLMTLFGEHIGHISPDDLASHMTQLQAFFLQCLDIRVDFPEVRLTVHF